MAIIPARGGSKGVPRKNLQLVGGKPLIAWTILAAQQSALVQDYWVSTDDAEIAAVARDWGAAVFGRPAAIAGDRSPMIEVIAHALETAESVKGRPYATVLLLQPTAPLRLAEDIDGALSALEKSAADSVISVYRVEDAHPARMYRLENELLVPLHPEPPGSLRQDLPAVYHRNGAIYAATRRLIVEGRRLWGG
ncbi:acylneuraminate cytidylyltransferase family protein, partial [bacterium]|nr:acylneuraminate cytidylyltransferase family protein [bacterium]